MTVRSPSERAVKARLTRRLAKRGAYVVTQYRARRGVTDLIVCYRGFYLGIEVKRPGWTESDVRPEQRIEERRVRKAGGVSAVVSTDAELDRLLDALDDVIEQIDPVYFTALLRRV